MFAKPSTSGGIVSAHTRQILSLQDVTSMLETDPLEKKKKKKKRNAINLTAAIQIAICYKIFFYILWHIFASLAPR